MERNWVISSTAVLLLSLRLFLCSLTVTDGTLLTSEDFFSNLNYCKCYQLWGWHHLLLSHISAACMVPDKEGRSFISVVWCGITRFPLSACLSRKADMRHPPPWPFSDWPRAGGRLALPLAICARQRWQLRGILTIQRMRLQQKSDPGFPRVEEWTDGLSPSASCMPFSRGQVAAAVSPLSVTMPVGDSLAPIKTKDNRMLLNWLLGRDAQRPIMITFALP